MRQSVDKTKYFLDFSITIKSLELVDNISNQFNHQHNLIFLSVMSEMRPTGVNVNNLLYYLHS